MTSKMNKLKVINFKNIQNLEIAPMGNSLTLKGKNGAGKSAVIQAVEWALRGKRALPEGAMKIGEDKTEVVFENDDFIITRTWTRGRAPSVSVRDKKGMIFPSPQKMLDEIVSNLSFDPTEFLIMSEADQVKALKALIDSEGAISGMEAELAKAKENRLVLGREVRRLEEVVKDLPYYPDAPEQEVSSEKLLDAFTQAQEDHRVYREYQETIDNCDNRISHIKAEIAKLEQELQRVETEKSTTIQLKDALASKLPDMEEAKQAFQSADELNNKVRANKVKLEKSDELADYTERHEYWNGEVDRIKGEIEKAIRSSDIPVKGLTFTDDKLYLEGRPFIDCSAGERLEASLRISMALNKGLKMIAVKNGSLLDEARQAQVMKFAKQNGFQVIMEIVDTGAIEVIIEEEEAE